MKNSSQTQHHRLEAKRKEEKKIENSKLQDGMQGTVANGTVAAGSSRAQCISLWHSENFAILAKLGNFARLAKFR